MNGLEIIVVPEVEEIEINYYGIIKHAKIHFERGLNVIMGKNATGKSTVLRAIREACSKEFKNGTCKFRGDTMTQRALDEDILINIANKMNIAFLIDEAIDLLSDIFQPLDKLSLCAMQVIITTVPRELPKDVKMNVINSDKFQLRRPKRDYPILFSPRKVKK